MSRPILPVTKPIQPTPPAPHTRGPPSSQHSQARFQAFLSDPLRMPAAHPPPHLQLCALSPMHQHVHTPALWLAVLFLLERPFPPRPPPFKYCSAFWPHCKYLQPPETLCSSLARNNRPSLGAPSTSMSALGTSVSLGQAGTET